MWLLLLLSAVRADPVSNMNGAYEISTTPHGKPGLFPTKYADYPRGVTSFDVYSPVVSTLYSQVFWSGLDPVPLPPEIVKRFEGKGMAVVGFELDQVVRQSGGKDLSVPITAAYNHHFESTMIGKKAHFERGVVGPDDRRRSMGHGLPAELEQWVVVEDVEAGDGELPSSVAFGGANGGEVRKSFHGYAPGYVQAIQSPTHFQITPMQIDTFHREEMRLNETTFVSGPVPRSSLAPLTGPDALYSGLLECPLTTRIVKEVESSFFTQPHGLCAAPVDTASACFAAAAAVLGPTGASLANATVSDATEYPAGCTVATSVSSALISEPPSVHVTFNSAERAGAECGTNTSSVVAIGNSLMRMSVRTDLHGANATITMTGPADVWFGVGFSATKMADNPWTIVSEPSGVSERRLADHKPGTELSPSVTVIHSATSDGERTVILTVPLAGAYYTFNASAATLHAINAVGTGPTFGYHKDKAPMTLAWLPDQSSSGACVCSSPSPPFGGAKGSLRYSPTTQSADTGSGEVVFGNLCAPQPRSDLLAMRNPTCDLRTYSGGQIACHHMWSLLDADQEIPWADQPLEYQLKFRFHVQEYNSSYHKTLRDTRWGLASPVEFDVPKCNSSTLGCTMQDDGRWVHTIKGTFTDSGVLVAAHFHCHAPTCLSMALYRCPPGTKVCDATTGELLCEERPVYGATGEIFDERGFIRQPPCLWGDGEFGLEPPVNVSGFVLGGVKQSNATYGHHGEMAWMQVYLLKEP